MDKVRIVSCAAMLLVLTSTAPEAIAQTGTLSYSYGATNTTYQVRPLNITASSGGHTVWTMSVWVPLSGNSKTAHPYWTAGQIASFKDIQHGGTPFEYSPEANSTSSNGLMVMTSYWDNSPEFLDGASLTDHSWQTPSSYRFTRTYTIQTGIVAVTTVTINAPVVSGGDYQTTIAGSGVITNTSGATFDLWNSGYLGTISLNLATGGYYDWAFVNPKGRTTKPNSHLTDTSDGHQLYKVYDWYGSTVTSLLKGFYAKMEVKNNSYTAALNMRPGMTFQLRSDDLDFYYVKTIGNTCGSTSAASATGVACSLNGEPAIFGPGATLPDGVSATMTYQGIISTTPVPIPPTAEAGNDQAAADVDQDGHETFTLSAAGSVDADGTIVSYVWKEGMTQLATTATANVIFSCGTHTVVLTVTDNDGATASDSVIVRLRNTVIDPHQLMNLKDTPTAARFTLPLDRIWPANPGATDICLWADDRFAAMSLTIDDNIAPDQPWWIAQGEATGLRFTWFIITDYVVSNPGFGGTWAGYRNLQTLGHDVQSHTVLHLHNENPAWAGIDWEYRESQIQIETNMPGHRAIALAYPGSNSYLNDRTVAALYYSAARNVIGLPNAANKIDYLSINAALIGRDCTDSILYGTSSVPWLGNNQYLRGWLCACLHDAQADMATDLAYIKTKVDDNSLWFALFAEVAKYGQERDTAHLAVVENTAQRIRFTLSDDMDDTIFDYPLTIKVRLYSSWTGVAARQGGATIPVQTVVHDGATFALVKAVPDRGEVVLTPVVTDLAVTGWAVVANHGPVGNPATAVNDGYVESRLAGLQAFSVSFAGAVDPATVTQPAAVTLTGQANGDQSSRLQSLTLSGDGQTLTIVLSSSMPDADGYTITLTDMLRGTSGQPLSGRRTLAIRALAGDVDGSGVVGQADLLAARGLIGQPVGATTFRYDVNRSGGITGADLLAIRARLGSHLP